MRVTFDYFIVLGGRVKGTDSVSPFVKARLDAAVKVCRRWRIEKIILTGGVTSRLSPFSEAEIMKRYLVKRGIKTSQIIKEEKAENTIGNAFFSRKIIGKRKSCSVLVITSGYQIRRARFVFEKIFPKSFTIMIIGTPTSIGVSKNAGVLEKASMKYAMRNLKGITPGASDTKILKVLKYLKKHPASEEMKRVFWY